MKNFFKKIISSISFLFKKTFGILSIIIGIILMAWVLYNHFIEMQPEYEEYKNTGILNFLGSITFISVGIYWLRTKGGKTIPDNKNDLCEKFLETAKDILSKHPKVKHTWTISDKADSCTLEFPKQSDNGFDVTVEATPSGISVFAEGYHDHFDYCDDANELVQFALGLVRDLLSPYMRIRELCASGRPYRWHLEAFCDGEWQVEGTMGLLFWNYFGKRSEKIFQNSILEGRPIEK